MQDMFDRGGGIKVPRVFMITHDGSKDADMVKPAQETRKSVSAGPCLPPCNSHTGCISTIGLL